MKLKQAARPKHYDVFWDLDFDWEQDDFSGRQTITMESKEPCSNVLLNGKRIKLDDVKVNGEDVEGVSYDGDIIAIDLGKEVKGEFNLSMDFSGKFGMITGLHRSRYDGKIMITTQMEPNYGREALPCVDEPAAKASFDVSVRFPKGFTAISNMDIKDKEEGESVTVRFDTTPKMSTYLLYLGIGEFEHIEEMYRDVRVRVVGTPGKSEKYGRFAMEATVKFLEYFEDYFGINYPLGKLDMIAIPDFGAGAMENWGAITFREDALLFDPKHSSLSGKQRIAEVISHELVHQWFGNLVTMEWWNDLWLNESFADYMAYKAVAHHYPEMDPWSNFLMDEGGRAYDLDSLKSSHPINVNVETVHEIEEIFDEISYAKGGMVLRMLELFIGEDVFREGLNKYLSDNSYGNAEGSALWRALSAVSEHPVERIMEAWLNHTGFPQLDVSASGTDLELKQKRFYFLPEESDELWPVPLVMKGREEQRFLMEEEEEIVELEYDDYVKVNYGEIGFFRVRYDNALLGKLKESIEEMGHVDRWGLHNDQHALLVARQIGLHDYLEFIEAYRTEENYLVLLDLLGGVSEVMLLTHHEDFNPEIRIVARDILFPVLERLGWEERDGEPETDRIVRAACIAGLGRLDEDPVIEKCFDLFAEILEDKESVDPDVRRAVYRVVAWNAKEEDYEKLLKIYRETETPEEKSFLLTALSYSREKKLVRRTLDMGLTEEVRNQDLLRVIVPAARNPVTTEMTWEWVKKNWDDVKEIYLEFVKHFSYIIKSFSGVSLKQAQEIAGFLKGEIPGTGMAISQFLEMSEVNEKLLESIRKEFP